MELKDGQEVIVADDPASMAEAIIQLYQDEQQWEQMSSASLEFISRNYSSSLGKQRVAEIIELAGFSFNSTGTLH
jgi:glycosyltransferase involved in cell wall biosynthesis